jgi:hypothetical protein
MDLSTMRKLLFSFLLATAAAFAQYKSEPAGAPPADVAPDIGKALEQQGAKIVAGNGSAICEVWFRSSIPAGAKSAGEGVTLPAIQPGTLLGVIRFTGPGADRRGQSIKPGIYTLRYSLHPMNGDHLGVSPQRDFLVMVPAADDKDLNATPDFDALMAMSRKASGTPHPAVLSMWAAGAGDAAGFAKQGENDWVLTTKIGGTPVSVILVGKAEG